MTYHVLISSRIRAFSHTPLLLHLWSTWVINAFTGFSHAQNRASPCPLQSVPSPIKGRKNSIPDLTSVPKAPPSLDMVKVDVDGLRGNTAIIWLPGYADVALLTPVG